MFCSHVCVAQAHLRLAYLELAVYVGIKSVVPSSHPEQNDLLWSVQFVEAVWLFEVLGVAASIFSWWGFWWWSFHRCKRCICPLGPAGLHPEQTCLLVHFLWSRSVLESTAGLGLSGLRGRPGQFPPLWDPSGGDFGVYWGQREHLWIWQHWAWFGVGCVYNVKVR